jgi:hypothetical protein
MPSSTLYEERFAGLLRAYALVGFEPERDYRYLSGYRQRHRRAIQLREQIASAMRARGMDVVHDHPRTLVIVCNGIRVAALLALRQVIGRKVRWTAQVQLVHRVRWVLIGRTVDDGVSIRDYWLTQGGHHLFYLGAKMRKGRTWQVAEDFWPLLEVIEASSRCKPGRA